MHFFTFYSLFLYNPDYPGTGLKHVAAQLCDTQGKPHLD